MPITRLPNGKLLYFAHVPKCAGSAVEQYLKQRFGVLGLQDGAFAQRSASAAWSLSPPQHMPEAVRRDWLPDALFDGLFATVRHPLKRLQSVFLFQREVEGALPAQMPFHRWIDTLPRSLALAPYALHGHLRPMAEVVPETAAVFRIEDGLDPVVDWLDGTAGTTDGPRAIAPYNTLKDRLKGNVPEIDLTPEICARVAQLYAVDYARFGYSEDPGDRKGTT